MNLSFVIIAYNEEHGIARTLENIFALEKLPKSFEVVVVNDGSRDQTLAIVKEIARKHPEVRIVDLQPNRGRGAARAAGVEAAQGKYIAFVDADILLPEKWYETCLKYIKYYDACGGTAVPDGDVAWIHRIFKLPPKVAAHSTTVSGSNGLFSQRVFNKVTFNPNKKDGEDVDLGYQIQAANIKTISIPGLVVEHNEYKTYLGTLRWLYQSGKGASRQFYEHKEVRLPDIAFFGFVGIVGAALVSSMLTNVSLSYLAVGVIGYVTASSLMHLRGKFTLLASPVRSLLAVFANDSLLTAYYLGRCVGLAIGWNKP